MVTVRRLAFIESSAVFDDLNLRSPRQSDKSSTSSLLRVFSGKSMPKVPSQTTLPNTSLISMLNKCRSRTGSAGVSSSNRVPGLICRLLHELCSPRCANTEGLFRIPPSQQRLRQLLQTIQTSDFNENNFNFSDVPPNDLAALFKHVVRSLSPTLLTSSLEHLFVLATSGLSGGPQPQGQSLSPEKTPAPPANLLRERLRLLNLLILQLPDVHRDTLQLILSCLYKLSSPSSHNRMSASSLAVVLTPLFFPTPPAVSDPDQIHHQALTLQLLIMYADVLFVVPNQLLDQVRLHNTLLLQRDFVSRPKQNRKVAIVSVVLCS